MDQKVDIKEVLLLIAELAETASRWGGGACEGTVYTDWSWRNKLLGIKNKAVVLAAQAQDVEQS